MNNFFKKVAFLLVILFWTNASLSCDLLGFNIGGDKSDIEHYFGSIGEDTSLVVDSTLIEETDESSQQKFFNVSTEIDDVCPSLNLGNSIFKAIIIDNIIAAVGIEVINGTANAESKKKLLYNYVTTIFGAIENSEDPEWTGYKIWNIGDREIIYAKTIMMKKHMIEEVLVTNKKYVYLISGNDE